MGWSQTRILKHRQLPHRGKKELSEQMKKGEEDQRWQCFEAYLAINCNRVIEREKESPFSYPHDSYCAIYILPVTFILINSVSKTYGFLLIHETRYKDAY